MLPHLMLMVSAHLLQKLPLLSFRPILQQVLPLWVGLEEFDINRLLVLLLKVLIIVILCIFHICVVIFVFISISSVGICNFEHGSEDMVVFH